MSEPTITIDDIVLPAGTITGHAGAVNADGYDPDPHPDLSAWEGVRITFTPTVPLVILTTADGPVLLEPRTETGRFIDGRLMLDLDPPGGEARQPLRLWASTGQDMVPPEWGWRATITGNNLPPAVAKMKPAPFALEPGATVDVAAVLSGSLPDVPPPIFDDYLAALTEMRQIRDEMQAISGLTGEDEAVALLVADANSATRAGVDTVATDIATTAASAAVSDLEVRLRDTALPAWAGGPVASKLAALSTFRHSLRIGLASDSTGNDANDWPTLWLKLFAAANPGIRVDRRDWNASTQELGTTNTIQAGDGGTPAKGGTMMQDNFNRTGNVIGSTSSGGQVWTGTPAGGEQWTMNGSRAVPSNVPSAIGIEADPTSTMTIDADVNVITAAPAAQRALRFIVAGTLPNDGGNRVWAALTISTTGNASLALYKVISGVSTALAATSFDVGIPVDSATSTPCHVTLSIDIQNVTVTLTTPTKTTTLTGTVAEADVAVLGDHAAILGGGASSFSLDGVTVETPFTPAQPAPGVSLVNGSVAGANLSYHSARLATMFPDPLDAMIISTGHNNGSQTAVDFRAEVEAFITLVESAQPDATIVLSSQNPQYTPAANPVGHRQRQAVMRDLARERGCDYIPAFEQFTRRPDGGVSMVGPDGVHPTTPPSPYDPVDGYGATLWARAWQAIIDRA